MPDENEEERKYYTLKPKSFERVNRPAHEEPQAPIDVRAMLQQNLTADHERIPAQNRAAPEATQGHPSSGQGANMKPPVLPVVRAKPRREKDFLTTLACAAMVFAVPAYLCRDSQLVLLSVGSAFAVFSLVMAWIFWGIMDRY